MKTDFTNVTEYIHTFPKDIQLLLKKVRATIKAKAPEAVEGISYGMPAYKTNGKALVYFAAFTNHIGFYATPKGHSKFKEQLSKYKLGIGSVQFPLDGSIPFALIGKIVTFRVKENADKQNV